MAILYGADGVTPVFDTDSDALKVTSKGALTDRSGAIAAPAASQEVAAALATRKYLLFQNLSAADMWLNFGIAAVQDQPSIRVAAGTGFVMEANFCSNESVNVIAAAAGGKFACKEA